MVLILVKKYEANAGLMIMCSTHHTSAAACVSSLSYSRCSRTEGALTTKEAVSPQAVILGYPEIFDDVDLYTCKRLAVNFLKELILPYGDCPFSKTNAG